jgi:hypothetical protein
VSVCIEKKNTKKLKVLNTKEKKTFVRVAADSYCVTMADSAKFNVLDDNDVTDLMDTSWSGPLLSRKRGTKLSLRKDSKFSKSIESLVDTSNRYDALSDEEEVEGPSPIVPSAPPPNSEPRKTLRATSSAPQQQKRELVPTITIKWQLTNVRSEIVLSDMSNKSFLLKLVHGGTVVKIASMKEYETFLKQTCLLRKSWKP